MQNWRDIKTLLENNLKRFRRITKYGQKFNKFDPI